ncbi:cytochrome P450 [Mycobacterium branderi]|uniref:Cytochrome n=1 Tax=Mycobacterium branderi TaxID=43348 RepID=A0A7I7WFB8_9MYCO|nr:cytochrome P450 [Mycobacterium branderi]MCV7231859.1 cytochrome P450 [Mycobacterium branderi]ORA40197.1 cytochrome [Mycobacterium branderi]BBZ15485.1 cytochrome P450 [Mycobacterium branderi]
MKTSQPACPITDDWLTNHFDHMSTDLGAALPEFLARMREICPVAHSDNYGGFWVITKYEDIFKIAQDWETFTSSEGVAVPPLPPGGIPNIPVEVDPPLQRVYKKLISPYLTPEAVARREQEVRAIAVGLIDKFIDSGQCEFMKAFAQPFPAVTLFELILNAPSDDVGRLADMATVATLPNHPDAAQAWGGTVQWINDFVDQRQKQPPRGDIVDGLLKAEIEGQPINRTEILGILQLLIVGGLDTTGGALGQMIIEFCRDPAIPALLRTKPELIPPAIEELLRLNAPMVAIARTATRDVEVGGRQIKKGDRIMMYWASANRDEEVFANPDSFDLERANKRYIAFGVGPHRCVGSNLARMNLRIALEEILRRLDDIRLQEGAEVEYHISFIREPAAVPITFKRR